MNSIIENEKLKRALVIAMKTLDWYADLSNYDPFGRPEENTPGLRASGTLSKVNWIVRGITIAPIIK